MNLIILAQTQGVKKQVFATKLEILIDKDRSTYSRAAVPRKAGREEIAVRTILHCPLTKSPFLKCKGLLLTLETSQRGICPGLPGTVKVQSRGTFARKLPLITFTFQFGDSPSSSAM